MTLRSFINLQLLDGEKLRVAEKTDAIVIERLKPTSYDEPEEWQTIHAEQRSPKGLEKCIDRATLYAHASQKELAAKAFDFVA